MWDIFKKVLGKKEATEQPKQTAPATAAPAPQKQPQSAAAVAEPPEKKPEPAAAQTAAKPAEQPKPAKAEPKKLSEEEQIEAELKKLPPEMMAHIKDPKIREKIVELAKKMIKDGVDLKSEKQVKAWVKNHPEAVQGAPAAPKPETFRREEPKVGRNDDCPCGSGKKFKKCCGNK